MVRSNNALIKKNNIYIIINREGFQLPLHSLIKLFLSSIGAFALITKLF